MFCLESSFHPVPRRFCQVVAELWLVRLQVVAGQRNHYWRQEMHITSSESRGTRGLRFVVLLWILWSIPMVVVTISTLVMPVLFLDLLHQGKRLVSSEPGGLVVSEDKLLLLLQNPTRVLRKKYFELLVLIFHVPVDIFFVGAFLLINTTSFLVYLGGNFSCWIRVTILHDHMSFLLFSFVRKFGWVDIT